MNSIAWTRTTHALLRIVAGLLFMMHGGQKLLGWFPQPDGPTGAPPLMSMMGVAGMLELVGGAMILMGLLTRPVAFLLAGEMAVAYFTAHVSHGLWPLQNGGEPAALFCFIFLFLAGNGSGGFSLDSVIQRSRHRTSAPDRERPDPIGRGTAPAH